MRYFLKIVTVTMRYSLKIVTVTMRYSLKIVTVTMSNLFLFGKCLSSPIQLLRQVPDYIVKTTLVHTNLNVFWTKHSGQNILDKTFWTIQLRHLAVDLLAFIKTS